MKSNIDISFRFLFIFRQVFFFFFFFLIKAFIQVLFFFYPLSLLDIAILFQKRNASRKSNSSNDCSRTRSSLFYRIKSHLRRLLDHSWHDKKRKKKKNIYMYTKIENFSLIYWKALLNLISQFLVLFKLNFFRSSFHSQRRFIKLVERDSEWFKIWFNSSLEKRKCPLNLKALTVESSLIHKDIVDISWFFVSYFFTN